MYSSLTDATIPVGQSHGLSYVTPTQTMPPRYIPVVQGRPEQKIVSDYLQRRPYFGNPPLGDTLDTGIKNLDGSPVMGILIDQSETRVIAGDILGFTRTFLEVIPSTWEEISAFNLQHDKLIEVPQCFDNWSAYKEQTVPPGESWSWPENWPQGDPTIEPPIGSTLTGVTTGFYFIDYSSTGVEDEWISWIRGNYQYAIDPVSRINIAYLRILAEQNTTLNPLVPSTAAVPIRTKVIHDYFVLPDGPTNTEFIQATPLQQFGFYSCFQGIPRSPTTVLEASKFTKIDGCLWERVVRYYGYDGSTS